MYNIVILDAKTLGDDLDLSVFNKFGKVNIYDFTKEEELVPRICNADIIINNKMILNKKCLKYADNIKLICLTGTGYNNVDIEYCKFHNIAVTNVKNYSTESVTQHTFALLFYVLENLRYYDDYVKKQNYVDDNNFTHFRNKFHEIYGKVWGIIGLGNIGKRVAEIANTFGCKIIYYSTTGKNSKNNYKRVQLDELLKKSDIISIHCPLNDKTRNLISYKELCKIKENAILLNLARGGIVNEQDFVKALDEDLIYAAGIDVLEKEPMIESCPYLKLKKKEKLILTPHIGWASVESRNRVIEEIVKNIEAFENGLDRNRVFLVNEIINKE